MKRLWYLDNLRIFLISLVVLHHLSITYGAPGSWYYNESQPEGLLILPLAMLVATNQAFFMGLFFLISAYFTEVSFTRKTTGIFLGDRFRRLAIPLVVFYFLISPFTVYCRDVQLRSLDISFWEFLAEGRGLGFGPLWFVETLLIFSLIYVVYQRILGRGKSLEGKPRPLPGDQTIILLAVLLGIISFLVRIKLPVGWSLPHLGLQFPHFPQYITLFALGIAASRNNWLEQITYKRGFRWFIFAQVMIFLMFPLLFITGGAAAGVIDPFMGGAHWQSLSYSVWEQVTGLSLMIGLLGIFKEKFNSQGEWLKKLSACAYGVFVFHTPVLILITVPLRNVELNGILKLLLLAPAAVAASFLVAYLVRKIPFVDRVL
jgi:surface polysaccharide O-acyltransferase-like enzyme